MSIERAPYMEWTDPELSLAAKKIVKGRGWLAVGVDVADCFGMLLALIPAEQVPENTVGMYADYDAFPPLPMAVNGKPQFTGGRFINADDAYALVDIVEALQNALETV